MFLACALLRSRRLRRLNLAVAGSGCIRPSRAPALPHAPPAVIGGRALEKAVASIRADPYPATPNFPSSEECA